MKALKKKTVTLTPIVRMHSLRHSTKILLPLVRTKDKEKARKFSRAAFVRICSDKGSYCKGLASWCSLIELSTRRI